MGVFCMTLPLSSNVLLGTEYLLQLLQFMWNGLMDYIRKENDFDKFKRLIKTTRSKARLRRFFSSQQDP